MTQDEIIRSPIGREQLVALAREAGLIQYVQVEKTCVSNALERFFNLAFESGAAYERQKFMALCEAEYKKYDELITEEDAGHEEATAIIHLMRKLEGMK